MPLRTLNRSAAVVRPREPFVEWATSVDAEAADFELEVRSHVSVYLVPSDPKGEQESAPLEQWCSEVFRRELEGWYTDETTWPPVLDVETFLKWFEVATDSLVVDLGAGPVEIQEM